MKRLRRALTDQKGQVFVVVLILMLVSALLITPLMNYMFSGRQDTHLQESRMDEYYAADAGVEDAIQNIKNKEISENISLQVPDPGAASSVSYALTTPGPRPPINGKIVRNVIISSLGDNATYKIVATAISTVGGTSTPTGTGTAIRAYVTIANFYSNLLENAITSPTSVNMSSNEVVNGKIQSPVIDWSSPSANATLDYSAPTWPPFVGLQAFYLSQVPASGPYHYVGNQKFSSATIPPGSFYVDGNLEIDGPGTVTLGGTVYVTGGVSFKNAPDLVLGSGNVSNTIYAYGNTFPPTATNAQSSSMAVTSVTLTGPGSLIARQGIYYSPNIPAGNDSFIFVVSTNGDVNFQPQNNTIYYGSIGAGGLVTFQPNATINWRPPPDFLNVPGGSTQHANIVERILTWDIDTKMPTIITSLLPIGEVGVNYATTLAAEGGKMPYVWSNPSGSLPGGLFFNSSGVITGQPTAAGTFSFMVQVTDNSSSTDLVMMSIAIVPALGSITSAPSPLPGGQTGIIYVGATMSVSGGKGPYSWIWSSFPPGLILSAGGSISGTPSTAGTYFPTFTVHDTVGGIQTTSLMSIVVTPSPLTITTTSLPNGKKNDAYGAPLGTPSTPVFVQALGGTGTYTWSKTSGAAWLAINSGTGQLTGTAPNQSNQDYPFSFSVFDGINTATKNLTIHVQ